MNWTTVYITGKSDFREDVRKRLEHSDLKFMPGYIDNSSTIFIHDLFWLEEGTNLHAFKEAIGSKVVWKHRLHFFDCLEDFVQSQNLKSNATEFSREELDLMKEIQNLVHTH